jgi:hypothetical protein
VGAIKKHLYSWRFSDIFRCFRPGSCCSKIPIQDLCFESAKVSEECANKYNSGITKEQIMETSGVSQSVATAALTQSLNTQTAEAAMIMKMLQQLQQLQMQVLQSLGIGQNINVTA